MVNVCTYTDTFDINYYPLSVIKTANMTCVYISSVLIIPLILFIIFRFSYLFFTYILYIVHICSHILQYCIFSVLACNWLLLVAQYFYKLTELELLRLPEVSLAIYPNSNLSKIFSKFRWISVPNCID